MRDKIQKAKLFILPCEGNGYRPTALDGRFLLYVTLVLVMLKFVSLFFFVLMPRTPYFADVSRGALVQMANQERISAGLKPLSESPELIEAAGLKAQDMLQKDYFSHWSPDGTSPWYWFGVAGYDYRYAGENLAIGFLDAKDVHRAWVESPSHKKNILGADYNEIGIAVVEGEFYGQRTFLVVQVFGSRDVPQPVSVPAPVSPEPVEEPVMEEELVPDDVPAEPIAEEPVIDEFVEEPVMEEELITDEEPLVEETATSSVLGAGSTISCGESLELKGFKYSMFSFLMLEYDDMIRQVIFYVMMFIGFVMVLNVFIRFDVQHPDLVFKGLGFLLLFLVFDQFDQMTLVRMITDAPWIA